MAGGEREACGDQWPGLQPQRLWPSRRGKRKNMAELTAEERRRARAAATVKIIRPGEEAAAALEDARYWERIPLSKRAEFIWQLSVEVFSLAAGAK